MAKARTRTASNLRRTIDLGVEFWNDSCDPAELAEAVAIGAVGATSNPVIVGQAVEAAPQTWLPVVDAILRAEPEATEDDAAWLLVERVVTDAARLLAPAHAKSGGKVGWLCAQVDPRLHRSAARMVSHAERLASLAPNIAVKIPATAAGVAAIEELASRGIRTNATVSFTVAQAVACAEAVERGVARAAAAGRGPGGFAPYVTIMIGRVDDFIRRLVDARGVVIDPAHPHLAGIAVFMQARRLFVQRRFRAKLLAAAYRHPLHWTELIGPGIVQSIPYAWWKRFEASPLVPRPRLDEPVEEGVVASLRDAFPEFVAAHDETGLRPAEFDSYGASVHTLRQFLDGYGRLVAIVRDRMVR
jgi:transaldolase